MLALALARPLAGQQPRLTRGDRVKVSAPCAGLQEAVMTVVDLSGGDLTLEGSRWSGHHRVDTWRVTVSLDSVRALAVDRGGPGHAGAGAALGFAVGAAVGVSVLAMFPQRGLVVIPAGDGVLVGIPGALIGALVGAGTRSERWETVLPDSLRSGRTAPDPD
jgi:hypothetical protein